MPVCRAIRRLHILQVQLMTASSRLPGDPSFLGMPVTKPAAETWGNQKYPGDQGAHKAGSWNAGPENEESHHPSAPAGA